MLVNESSSNLMFKEAQPTEPKITTQRRSPEITHPAREWSQYNIELLTVQWALGASSGELATMLNRSRSAIMGKIHRLGLCRKDHPEFSGSTLNTKGRIRTHKETVTRQAQPSLLKQTTEDLPPTIKIKPDIVKKPAQIVLKTTDISPALVPAVASTVPAALAKNTAQLQTKKTEAKRSFVYRPPVPPPSPLDMMPKIAKQIVRDKTNTTESLNRLEEAVTQPAKKFILEWLGQAYPDQVDYYDEMRVIVAGAVTNDITPIRLAQTAGVFIEDAKGVREAMIKSKLWQKDAGDLDRYDGDEGWLQLVLEAMQARGELVHHEGAWNLPEKTRKENW